MKEEDYIRKGVELAKGFSIVHERDGIVWVGGAGFVECKIKHLPQWFKDALAAQLVRQVNALLSVRNLKLHITAVDTQVTRYDWEDEIGYCGDEGRTMNTIKAIVDSGVLE